jgi:hypothetical protein
MSNDLRRYLAQRSPLGETRQTRLSMEGALCTGLRAPAIAPEVKFILRQAKSLRNFLSCKKQFCLD